MGGTQRVSGGTVRAEDAKLLGAGISLKQWPRKCVAEKGRRTELSDIGERGGTRQLHSGGARKSSDREALPGESI